MLERLFLFFSHRILLKYRFIYHPMHVKNNNQNTKVCQNRGQNGPTNAATAPFVNVGCR
jgi:hypothetical protein